MEALTPPEHSPKRHAEPERALASGIPGDQRPRRLRHVLADAGAGGDPPRPPGAPARPDRRGLQPAAVLLRHAALARGARAARSSRGDRAGDDRDGADRRLRAADAGRLREVGDRRLSQGLSARSARSCARRWCRVRPRRCPSRRSTCASPRRCSWSPPPPAELVDAGRAARSSRTAPPHSSATAMNAAGGNQAEPALLGLPHARTAPAVAGADGGLGAGPRQRLHPLRHAAAHPRRGVARARPVRDRRTSSSAASSPIPRASRSAASIPIAGSATSSASTTRRSACRRRR